MKWVVRIRGRAEKQVAGLPRKVAEKLLFLMADIAENGPVRGGWPNLFKAARQPASLPPEEGEAHVCGCLAGRKRADYRGDRICWHARKSALLIVASL